MTLNEALLEQNLRDLSVEHPQLAEALNRISDQFAALKFEDQGWRALFGVSESDDTGLTLENVKDISYLLREEVAGSALPKRANELRYSYTFGKPFQFPGVEMVKPGEDAAPKKRGRKGALQAFYDEPLNQRELFSNEAQFKMNAATSTDGCFLFLGDNVTKTGKAVPVSQIAGTYLNPDHNDEIWGYKREWTHTTPEGKNVSKKEWILTDSFPTTKKRPTVINGVAVAKDKTIIDLRVNTQTGWTFGVPDLTAGQVWNKKYLTMIKAGETVTKTYAMFAAKVGSKTQAGAEKIGAQVRKRGGAAGSVIATGPDNEIDVFSSAARTYDFNGLLPIASIFAASVGVPVTELLSSSSAAGSSYGSAATLIAPTRRSFEARRLQWAGFYERVWLWGTGKALTVVPDSIEEQDTYRKAQIRTQAWNSGLFHPDEIRSTFAEIADITLTHKDAPDGVLTPNNENSLPRKDIDTDSGGGTAGAGGQGVSTGDGGAGSTDLSDTRTDTISNEALAAELGAVREMLAVLLAGR